MKKLVALLLVVAFVFGFGFTVVQAVGVRPSVELYSPGSDLDPPPVWPPVQNNIIIRL